MINFTRFNFTSLCLFLTMIFSVSFASTNILISSKNSLVKFNVDHIRKHTVHGEFKDFNGVIEIRNNQFIKAEGKIIVKSIDTKNKIRNKYLVSKSFFNTPKFPFISFYSDSFITSGNQVISNGVLNMFGVSNNIALILTHDKINNRLITQTSLNRFDYNLKRHKRMIGSTVNILLDFSLEPIQ